ncbi:MAG: HEPN domain-containing protein [Crenarchaeota archaeon]|nr:HEPN domain-containing protein [Thermoproteota archaeon]MDW8033796.1 HEPN domain-containing protein [Nitrososphaerota archaeon]
MRKEEIGKLLERSRKFKDAAEFHFSRGDYDLAAFNIEQSLQLFLKAKLLEKGVEFPKTHTLRKLFILLGDMLNRSEEFKNFANEKILEFSSLEDAYVTARYFPRDFEKEEALKLLCFAEEVKELIGRVSD